AFPPGRAGPQAKIGTGPIHVERPVRDPAEPADLARPLGAGRVRPRPRRPRPLECPARPVDPLSSWKRRAGLPPRPGVGATTVSVPAGPHRSPSAATAMPRALTSDE